MQAHRRCELSATEGAHRRCCRFGLEGSRPVPLRKHAEEMRDMYANEIAAAVHGGATPSPLQVESWARYDAAARGGDPAAAFPPSGPVRT